MTTGFQAPELAELRDWWLAARAGAAAPSLAAFDGAALSVDRARCVLLRVTEGGARIVYERFGAVPQGWHGRDMTGHATDDWPPANAAQARRNVETTLAGMAPVYRRLAASAPGMTGQTEKLMLPLLGPGGAAEYVLVATYELAAASG